jgi:integrase
LAERHLVPTIGGIALDRLRPADIERLIAEKTREGKSSRTVQAIVTVLRIALKDALRRSLVTTNVATVVRTPRPRRDPDRVHALDKTTALRLLAAARGERLEALLWVLLFLGLRKGEALALRWSRVDLDTGTLHVDANVSRKIGGGQFLKDPKNETSSRTVAIPPGVVVALQAHRARQLRERLAAGGAWQDRGMVFCTPTGELLDLKAPNDFLTALCKRSGVPNERVHNLRHTTATMIGEATGGDYGAIKSVLGHSSISVTTDMYRHIATDYQRRAVAGAADLLLGAGPQVEHSDDELAN